MENEESAGLERYVETFMKTGEKLIELAGSYKDHANELAKYLKSQQTKKKDPLESLTDEEREVIDFVDSGRFKKSLDGVLSSARKSYEGHVLSNYKKAKEKISGERTDTSEKREDENLGDNLSYSDVAIRLGVHVSTIYRYMSRNELDKSDRGYVTLDSVEKFERSHNKGDGEMKTVWTKKRNGSKLRVLKPQTVAVRLGINLATVNRFVKKGKLERVRRGAISEKSLAEFRKTHEKRGNKWVFRGE